MPTFRFLAYATSWFVLAACVARGLYLIPNEIIGGTYSNTDGQWLAWNAISILRYADFLDLSPYNAFAGMGSMFLPNLPWLNPGALALALPYSQQATYIVSYLTYMALLAGSTLVLARALGFSWIIGTLAAQLHVLVLFPPFSYFFGPIEWYSAAPMYVQLSAILNVATAVFLRIGRPGGSTPIAAAVLALPLLVIAGLISAPFSLVFFTPPYITLAVVILFLFPPSRRELVWKIAGLVWVAVVCVAIGYPDYLRGMMETSARTPAAPIVWDSLLSPSAWLEHFRLHNLCADPRTLICQGNSLSWLPVVALAGSAMLAIYAKSVQRAVGIWGVLYIAGVHVYAFLFSTGWLGPLAALSNHFLAWASYSILVLPAIAALPVALAALWDASKHIIRQVRDAFPRVSIRSLAAFVPVVPQTIAQPVQFIATWLVAIWLLLKLIQPWAPALLREPNLPPGVARTELRAWWDILTTCLMALIAWKITVLAFAGYQRLWPSIRRRAVNASAFSQLKGAGGSVAGVFTRLAVFLVALSIVPLAAMSFVPRLKDVRQSIRPPSTGAIVDHLARNSKLEIGASFRGYTATVWSEAVNAVLPNKLARDNPTYRYIGGRHYFERNYGHTFMDVDLWMHGIPTFEEYGQWVTRQAQVFSLTLFGTELAHQTWDSRLLRIYELNIDVMRALGIRYLITDKRIQDDGRLILLVTQQASGALPVHLYELRNVNIANLSPMHPRLTKPHVKALMDRIADNAGALDTTVFVTEPIGGALVPAMHSRMTLLRDGYRVVANASGRSLLVLPIQFSHCLTVRNLSPNSPQPRLVRANFLQTGVVFERNLDVEIEFRFGLFGSAACRRQDGRDIAALTSAAN